MKKTKSEKFNNHASVQVEVYNHFISYLTDIIEVVKKYDNKIINKRFLDSLKNISPKHKNYCDIDINDFIVDITSNGSLSIRFNGITKNKKDINDNDFEIGCVIGNYKNNNGSIYGDRLNAVEYIVLIENKIEYFKARIGEWENYCANYNKVSKVYSKAYELLLSVKEFRYLAWYSDEKEMERLKNVFISEY